jgi:outer membrane protein insertion porin family
MHLQIPVSEGERWRLGEITINGNERFSDQQLLQTFEIRGGTWLRSKKIDDALKTINDIYQNSGFLYARAQPELKEREGQVADLVVRIQEGDQFTVRRIEFEGNVRTRDKVLRRELRVQEGYLMNTGALRSSVFKVNQLGYFQLNQEDPVNIDVDGEAKKVDLVFQGEEADRTELSFGGGYSDNFGFEGQFGLRTRNFLGRGETLSANLQRGQFREVVDVSYFVPWFLDRPQTIGFQVFDTTFDRFFGSDNQNVQQERRGATFTYGRSFKLFQQLSFAVSRSELDDFFPTSIDDDGDLEFQRFERRFSSVTPSWTMDSRDSRFEPTRGRRFLATVQFAGGSLGGDTELIRPEVALSFFKPVTRFPLRTVFAINAQGGYVELNEDSIISPLDRFFLGGESSIRGHARNTISVRDENGERRRDPDLNLNFVGGEAFLQFNVEYHVLLGGPLRALLFYDAGNVFADDQFDDLFNLRQTAGIELRLLLPVFGAPLRFIYATNLDELPNDDFESFQFSIGSSF